MVMSDHDVAALWEAIHDWRAAPTLAEAERMARRIDTLIGRFAKRQPENSEDKALAYLKAAVERDPHDYGFARTMLKDVYGLRPVEVIEYRKVQ